ncbi:unnamed protein product [Paramecium sonneborni]|uniref:Uncharacterized protein n=1 Tax=Paramecium sonneborni TaxID=65129 RepID=A0A8S1M1V0_9CILI|nr:unnamed protein product [Paramecium sonneborni]
MQFLFVKNTQLDQQLIYRSYSCHQSRQSEINNRKINNNKIHLNIIESSKRNKFFNSKEENKLKSKKKLYKRIKSYSIKKQKQNLVSIVSHLKIEFHSHLDSLRTVMVDQIEQKQKNIKYIKDNSIIKQKIFQICIS